MKEIPIEEEYLDILQNIEWAIHSIYVENPALTDYEVDRALESLVRAYQGEERGKAPLPPRSPMSLKVYDSARAACEVRLGRAPIAKHLKKLGMGEMQPVSVDVIVQCLKRIRKSIKLWSKEGGRQGYLYYISQFMA